MQSHGPLLRRQPGYRTSRGFVKMADSSVGNLLRTLHDLQRALQAMQTALVEFEGGLIRQSSSRPDEFRICMEKRA